MALTRSEQMARIRGRNTSPELLLRQMLWQHGLRYRLHARTPTGRPDIVFPGARVAVFVDGCFWHGCPDHYVRPRSRSDFWAEKLKANVLRDIRQTRELELLGWRVLRVWEHEVFEDPERIVGLAVSATRARQWRPPSSWRAVRVVAIAGSVNQERWSLRELRDPVARRTITRARTTNKWRRAEVAGVGK